MFLFSIGIGHSGEITRVKIAPDGKHLVSVSADGAIIRWRMPQQKRLEKPTEEDEALAEQTENLMLNDEVNQGEEQEGGAQGEGQESIGQ